jgi:hypothetical protein
LFVSILSPYSLTYLNLPIIFSQIGIQAYIVDAFTLYAASGMAANAIMRSVMAAVIPLAGPKIYQALGLGWGNPLLAFLALAISPFPVVLLLYGDRMNKWNAKRMKTL